MANTILTPDLIGKEAAYQVFNNCVLASKVNRQYEKNFKGGQGDSVDFRMPNKFTVKDGATRVNQNIVEKVKPITVNQRKHVSFEYPMVDKTLSMEQFSERYIKPAMIPLANDIDRFLASLGKQFYQTYGTAGTTPSTYKGFAGPGMILNHAAVPQQDRHLVLDPTAELNAADFLTQLPNNTAGSGALRNGKIGRISTFDTAMDQNIAYHTKSSAGTPLVNGANQHGGTLTIDGITGTAKAGDVFTIAGVNMVNPVSKEDTGLPQQFVVLEDKTGAGEIKISPEIIGPGDVTDPARQTVTCSPADNAALTFIDSHRVNMAFHKNAIGLVTVPLAMPESAGFKARHTYKGISIRMVKAYSVDSDIEAVRFDILYGGAVLYPEYGCRLLG